MSDAAPLPIAVFISGGGTTLKNLLDKISAGELPAEVKLVVSSNSAARGLQFAVDANVPTLVIEKKHYPTPEAYSQAMFQPCRDAGVRLVAMGGFLKHVLIPDDFAGRVMNIHPSLIPAFCGQGFYGERVHQAALDYGVKVSGCTVHFVDNHYDHGPIISQYPVPVLNHETPHTLAARIFKQECQAYPEAIRLFAAGRLRIEGRTVIVKWVS
jgi:phosphoribosylglycinamide formyltransferase-1